MVAVPNGDREHAVQTAQARRAVNGKCVDKALGIRICPEDTTARLQAAAELAVVIDFAVEDDREPALVGGDGLVPMLEVDDAEAAHCKRHMAVDELASIVRPTMLERIPHPAEPARIRETIVSVETPDYAAHGRSLTRITPRFGSFE